ncbi:copper resistance protein CopC [Streptomyces sp. Li-HN-5-11]|uniref:copper resistance CopC/CopD family protein n=1 Tax=Streptomyces sp. Li-HN-5-11 TaxID=3075432 RepID=UPI0028A82E49|nr:copper resistance protein CopC [Streptomyces sp. Li-HN-5-11]WNM29057.1 copper resistance protein CopC [Streptomyces sp. Li-HN-5-11]
MGRRHANDGRHTIGPLLALIAVIAGALLASAAPASAHAVLTGSDPRDGSVLKTAPKQITATFDESVALVEDSLRVIGPDGRPVTAGDPRHAGGRGDTARVPLTSGLGQGTYTVSWRVVSADSHAVSGAFTFSVGKPSQTGSVAPPPAVNPAVEALYGVGRYTAYGALALLIGVAVFVLACWPSATAVRVVRRPFVIGWWALVAATVALVLLRGPYDGGGGPAGILDPGSLRRTAGSRPGIALLARLVLLLLVAALVRLRPPEPKPARRVAAAGGALALGLAATWAASEHASAGIQVPVAMTSSVLHLLAMAVWLGGLAALLLSLYRAPADEPLPPVAVARFSRIALVAVALLAATGVYQSWRGLGSWEAFSTPYGRILAFKIWAVLLMLLAASHSRRWTAHLLHVKEEEPVLVAAGRGGTAPAASAEEGDAAEPGQEEPGSPDEPGPQASRRGLRRSVLAEVTVGVVVLVLTTALTGTQTGRAAEETAATASRVPGQPDVSLTLLPYDTGKNTLVGRGKIQVTLEPGRVGRNVVQALVYGADGSIVAIPELRVTLTHAGRRIGPLDAQLADERGYWGSDTLNLPLAGTWTMRATVRVSDIDQVTVSKTVTIEP